MKKNDFNYFEYFSTCGHFAYSAAKYLHETLANYDLSALPERVDAMHHIENKADMAKHEMMRCLAREFITPLEREDIAALSQELDNVVDAADEVMQRAYMFNIVTMRQGVVEFSELIVECCHALCETLDELGNFKKATTSINRHIVEVNRLESVGDAMHNENIRRLFTGATDARELLVWNIMFECMENCLDACEHAANVVESVIMKNS